MSLRKASGASTLFLAAGLFSVTALGAQGRWEFGVHYSRWTFNLVRPYIEDDLSETLESDIKERFLEDIQADNPSLRETGYSQRIRFDSGGNNYGFEVRYYPGGRRGSFSLGLSVEKTSMRVSFPEVSAAMNLRDETTGESSSFTALANGEVRIEPLSFHINVRWDIVPSAALHPYITFGLGLASGTEIEKGKYRYAYSGDLVKPDGTEHYEDSAAKTVKELKDEEEAKGNDFFLPGVLPFVQLNLGLKGVLTENIHLLADFGVWDGFLFRAGLALTF